MLKVEHQEPFCSCLSLVVDKTCQNNKLPKNGIKCLTESGEAANLLTKNIY